MTCCTNLIERKHQQESCQVKQLYCKVQCDECYYKEFGRS